MTANPTSAPHTPRTKTVPAEPLSVGPLRVWPPVVLAPMAGVTNTAFRRLCRQHGAGLYISEMVTARALVEGNAKTMAMVTPAEDESPRSVQLYAVDPATLSVAIRRLVEQVGVDHIDFNLGCPAAKVTRKGGGSALPLHPVLLRRLLAAAVKAAGDVPFTVKFRLGIDDNHLTYLDTGRIAEAEGCAAVALHARTTEQLYSGRADWDRIGELKAAVSIPVLGNGDIWEASDAMDMVRRTGCDGVVIGRGCLGRPWLFGELAAAFDGRPAPAPPTFGQVLDTMVHHGELLVERFGELTAMREMRKHAAWYTKGFRVGGQRRLRLGTVSSMAEFLELIGPLNREEPFPSDALRAGRGHMNGPRKVHLPEGWLESRDDPNPPHGAELLVSGG